MNEQLTERYCVMVNGHAVEPGCWVDGHWGQYGPDHLADRAEELGWEARHVRDDPRRLRKVAEWLNDRLPAAEPYCTTCRTHVSWIDAPTDDNPRQRRAVCESVFDLDCPSHNPIPTWPTGTIWEIYSDAADDVALWLNDNTETEGYSWGWHDGEFYLWPTETWEETE